MFLRVLGIQVQAADFVPIRLTGRATPDEHNEAHGIGHVRKT
jgi:hypothetical protein